APATPRDPERSWSWDPTQQLLDAGLGRHTACLRSVVEQQPVAQRIGSDGLHVLRCDELARIEPCERPRAALDRDGRARARAPAQPLAQLRAVRLRPSCRIYERGDVVGDRL